MKLSMIGLDYERTPIALREQLSLNKDEVKQALKNLSQIPNVYGAVLLSTCNRTELYLSYDITSDDFPCNYNNDETVIQGIPNNTKKSHALIGKLLTHVTNRNYDDFKHFFIVREEDDCINHLFSVASGLKSQILGEDQILSQVRTATYLAREENILDAVLNTLTREAITCGKQLKTKVHIVQVASSTAQRGVQVLQHELQSLSNKNALVIGNGEMGKLVAEMLYKNGANVWVTLRSYRHGTSVVPRGCLAVPYEKRYEDMPNMDIVISATTSPHHTITYDELQKLSSIPSHFIDLAIPRDIEPRCKDIVSIWDVDDLGGSAELPIEITMQIDEIIDSHIEKFKRWRNYRDCMPVIDELKEAILSRIADIENEETVLKTIDLVLGGLTDIINPTSISQCASGIRLRTRTEKIPTKKQLPFPMFFHLSGKIAVVIGAGKIGTRRAEKLVDFGATVRVVDPVINIFEKKFCANSSFDNVTFFQKEYCTNDLDDAFICIVATNDRELNRQIARECNERGIFVNVADDHTICDFYFPALCQGDGLIVGLVSDGTQHNKTASVAKEIRKLL